MSDTDCTAFLQWALPQLNLRWSGFRKVHRQVCKRLKRRMNDLGVADFAAYRTLLEADPAEWHVLDECCHITISRFFREKRVFEVLRSKVLPQIAARAHREERAARMWSGGCASGEEPYTLKILWDLEVARPYPACWREPIKRALRREAFVNCQRRFLTKPSIVKIRFGA